MARPNIQRVRPPGPIRINHLVELAFDLDRDPVNTDSAVFVKRNTNPRFLWLLSFPFATGPDFVRIWAMPVHPPGPPPGGGPYRGIESDDITVTIINPDGPSLPNTTTVDINT